MWLPEDVAEQLAWQAELDLIGPCGQPHNESMSPDAEGTYQVSALRCHACAEMARKGRTMTESGASPDGLFLSVKRT